MKHLAIVLALLALTSCSQITPKQARESPKEVRTIFVADYWEDVYSLMLRNLRLCTTGATADKHDGMQRGTLTVIGGGLGGVLVLADIEATAGGTSITVYRTRNTVRGLADAMLKWPRGHKDCD